MATTSRSNPSERIILGAILVWTLLVFAHYFSIKAFDLSFLTAAFSDLGQVDTHKLISNWASFLRNLIYACLISFILWRVGRKLFHWLGLEIENIPLRFSLEMALGILFFNNLWLGLGLNGLWFDSIFLVLGIVFLGFSLWDFPQAYMKFQRLPRFEWPSWFELGLGCLGVLFLALSLAQGFTPEVYYDSLVYHLSTLSFWKFHHGIAHFYTNLYSNYPFGAELYFLNGFFLQGSETAKMLNVLSSALCASVAAGWVMEEAGMASGLLTWAMVLAFPWVSASVWTTRNDILLAFFLILFFYALARFTREKQSWKWAITAGLLGGAALSVKYTAVLGVYAGLLAICFTFRENFRLRHWTKWGVIKSLIFLALVPWFLKNFIYTGNPVYPYLSHWLGGHALSLQKMNSLMNDHKSSFLGGFSIWTWMLRVFTEDLDKTIGPILFSFLPFFFLPGRRRPVTIYLMSLSGLWLFAGFLVSHQLRLMIPAFITCFVLMAFVLADLQKVGWTRAWACIVIVFSLFSFLSLCRLSVDFYHGDQIWLGKETSSEYLSKEPQTASYYGLTRAVEALPPTDQLLIAGDARGLYYPRPFYANSVFDDQVLELLARDEMDGEGIWRGLRKMGIDDLVVSGEEGIRLYRQYPYYHLQPQEWAKLEDFIQHRTDLLFLNGLEGIYRIRPTIAERKSPIPNLLSLFPSAR